VVNLLFKNCNFLSLCRDLFLLFQKPRTFRACGVVQCRGVVSQRGTVTLLLLVDVISPQFGQQVGLIAVQINQRLEAVFLAAV
jgi:hypothetical protein